MTKVVVVIYSMPVVEVMVKRLGVRKHLLFIDTWHAYKQLIAELRLHQANVSKYIVLHDTTSYANHDESSYESLGEDWKAQGIGLWKAVEDFLIEFPAWEIEHRYTHNNGLTILRRK